MYADYFYFLNAVIQNHFHKSIYKANVINMQMHCFLIISLQFTVFILLRFLMVERRSTLWPVSSQPHIQ